MKPNLSTFERVIRPLLGLVIASVALAQPDFGVSEELLMVCALFLILNGIMARCYLWKWLGINTYRNEIDLCRPGGRQRD